jgi:hypothetical protein
MTSAPSTFSAYRMIERETVNRNYFAGEQHDKDGTEGKLNSHCLRRQTKTEIVICKRGTQRLDYRHTAGKHRLDLV